MSDPTAKELHAEMEQIRRYLQLSGQGIPLGQEQYLARYVLKRVRETREECAKWHDDAARKLTARLPTVAKRETANEIKACIYAHFSSADYSRALNGEKNDD